MDAHNAGTDPATSEDRTDGERDSAASAGSESPEEGSDAIATAEDAVVDDED